MEEVTIQFYVEGKTESPTKVIAKVREFEIVVDETPELGGTNEGPNPVEYLLVALAGCLAITGHLVAEEKGIGIRSIRIKATGILDPRKFQGLDGERAGYKKIKVEIFPEGNFTESELSEWIKEVEERCPVSDNLKNPTPVEIKIKTKDQYGRL
ncbi:OsmC family protein [Thermococcus sp. 2319x1]|uniref:OsmC family protein n=1 Tax=Thermococcus sp. 2319x1 TaxID=1674923 RepID=UPI001E631BE4|nr:OsmC family protein [Thermococcus sp. 2319x1]